jgi:hypothetical protein
VIDRVYKARKKNAIIIYKYQSIFFLRHVQVEKLDHQLHELFVLEIFVQLTIRIYQ